MNVKYANIGRYKYSKQPKDSIKAKHSKILYNFYYYFQ